MTTQETINHMQAWLHQEIAEARDRSIIPQIIGIVEFGNLIAATAQRKAYEAALRKLNDLISEGPKA